MELSVYEFEKGGSFLRAMGELLMERPPYCVCAGPFLSIGDYETTIERGMV